MILIMQIPHPTGKTLQTDSRHGQGVTRSRYSTKNA